MTTTTTTATTTAATRKTSQTAFETRFNILLLLKWCTSRSPSLLAVVSCVVYGISIKPHGILYTYKRTGRYERIKQNMENGFWFTHPLLPFHGSLFVPSPHHRRLCGCFFFPAMRHTNTNTHTHTHTRSSNVNKMAITYIVCCCHFPHWLDRPPPHTTTTLQRPFALASPLHIAYMQAILYTLALHNQGKMMLLQVVLIHKCLSLTLCVFIVLGYHNGSSYEFVFVSELVQIKHN